MMSNSNDFKIFTLTYSGKYTGTDEEVVIPEGVNVISSDAFKDNTSVKSVVMPNTVTCIDPRAFYGCSSLERITLSDNLKYIDYKAFADCISLSQIELPSSLKAIGAHAFENSGLTSIALPKNIRIMQHAFEKCLCIQEIFVPADISMDYGVFSGCKGLTKVCFEHGTHSVENSFISGCSNLTTVMLPDGVTRIDDCSFYLCDSLKKIYIPQSVTSIGRSSFYRIGRKNKLTIQAPKGSYAIKYAKKMHFKYEYVEENPYVNG